MFFRGSYLVLSALIFRPLRREKVRTFLTVCGIAVGVAVLVAIQLSNNSALRAFRESVDSVAGRANFQLVSDAGFLDEEVLFKLQRLWDTGARFAPVIDIDAMIEPGQAPIRILAVDLLSDLHFRDYRYASISTDTSTGTSNLATYPELFREDSIILPERFAAERGLALNDTLTLNALGRRVPLRIRGILKTEGPGSAFSGSLGILDIATAQTALGLEGKLSRVDLMIPESRAAELVAMLSKDLPPSTRIERPSRRNERVNKMLRAFRINLFALAAVALLVGIFLVYNTVLISILRRRRDIGVLKTLGVSPMQIFFAFISEAAVLGLLGAVGGIALGWGIAWATLELIGRTINALYVTSAPQDIELTPLLIAVALALGILVSIASSIQPSLEAAAVRPSTLIRPGVYQGLRIRRTRGLAVTAMFFFAAGGASSMLPARNGLPIGGYASVVLVLIGFALLSPFILRATAHLLRPLLASMFRMPGKLAAAAVTSSLRRTSIATAALAVAIGMMVAVSLMVGSFRETVRVWVEQTVRSDLWIRPARGLSNSPVALFPEAISEDLRRIPWIAAFDRVRGRDLVYQDHLIAVGSGDFDVLISHGNLPMVQPRSHREALAEALRTNGAVISESLSLKFGLHPRDSIDLPAETGVTRVPITGVYRDYSNDRGVVVLDRGLFKKLYRDDGINTIAVFLKPGMQPERARVLLEQQLGSKYNVFAFTNASIRSEVMKIFDQTFLITYALLGVAIIVAVLGIVNTLSALILERTREISILRVIGMSRGEIATMIVLESVVLGIAATALGAAIGYVLSYVLIYVINKQSFGWTIEFHPPMQLIILSLMATFLATTLAGFFPARFAQRVRFADQVKVE